MAKNETVDQNTGEIVKSKFNPANVKVKKQLTLSVLRQEKDKPVYVYFVTPMHVGKPIKTKTGEKEKEPATIATVIDLERETINTLVMSTVAQGILNESHPDAGYVGKSFMITNKGKQNGKEYNSVEIVEIENPEGIDYAKLSSLVV